MFASPFSNGYHKFSVKRSGNEIEFQEVFLDKLAQEKEEESLGSRKLEVLLPRKILHGLYIFFLCLTAVFLFKTVEFQVFSRGRFEALAQRNAIREIPIFADRGVIYDSSFRQFAFNKPSFDLLCDKRDMPQHSFEKENILSGISAILSVSRKELEQKFEEDENPQVLLQENISHEKLVALQTKMKDFQGCEIKESRIREYPEGKVFAHLLGYTAKISSEELKENPTYFVSDQIGKTGVEKSYEGILRGKPGKVIFEKDSFGNTIQKIGEFPALPGNSIVLWLDGELQKKITDAILRIFQTTGTKKAAAVAIDPRSGGVLALVSLPSFDNNSFAQGISRKDWEALIGDPLTPLFNRAMSGVGYPTGSVIKPFVGIGALEEHIISEDTVIYAPLEICVQNQYTKVNECFPDWTFHGDSDIKRAIAESVNTFFYIIGGGYEDFRGLGAKKILEYLTRFGFGEYTFIDLPGEGKGILPTIDEDWRLGDTYHLSIGQGPFAVPPLQVANAFVPIANGGTLLKPQVVKKIIDSQKNTIEEFEPKIIRKDFVDPANLKIIREGMRQTVTAGSATKWLANLPVSVAAKTGTAQTGKKDWDGKDFLYSWTVAFAPYENPELVFVVMIEDSKINTATSLPIVREVFQWYFSSENRIPHK